MGEYALSKNSSKRGHFIGRVKWNPEEDESHLELVLFPLQPTRSSDWMSDNFLYISPTRYLS